MLPLPSGGVREVMGTLSAERNGYFEGENEMHNAKGECMGTFNAYLQSYFIRIFPQFLMLTLKLTLKHKTSLSLDI